MPKIRDWDNLNEWTGLDVLYMLPKAFLDSYEILFNRAMKWGTSPAPVEKAKVGKGKGPKVQGGGKRHRESFLIRDEKAFDLKKQVDYRLRKLAREVIRGRLEKMTLCSTAKCHMWHEPDWVYCPRCGTELKRNPQ